MKNSVYKSISNFGKNYVKGLYTVLTKKPNLNAAMTPILTNFGVFAPIIAYYGKEIPPEPLLTIGVFSFCSAFGLLVFDTVALGTKLFIKDMIRSKQERNKCTLDDSLD